MTASPRLSVLVVAFESAGALAALLPALERELGDGDELVVVDNASTDDSVAVVRELAPGASLLRNGANVGFAAAAASAVRSVEPSSMTTTSHSGASAWMRRTTSPTVAASL